jgi:hypothetical protein
MNTFADFDISVSDASFTDGKNEDSLKVGE